MPAPSEPVQPSEPVPPSQPAPLPEPTPEPAPAQPVEPGVPDPPRSRSWLPPTIIAGAIVAVFAITAGLVFALRGPETFALTGTLTINSASTASSSADGPLPEGFACTGAGPLSDIQPNLRVIVADGRHELLGKGELTSSFTAEGSEICVFGLVVLDVPRDRAEYLVQLSHRGEASFTQDEAVAGIELTLNG